jgi:hypothetical protein
MAGPLVSWLDVHAGRRPAHPNGSARAGAEPGALP